MWSKVGTWFTALTTTAKLRSTTALVVCPSLTLTVTVQEPKANGWGERCSKAVAPGLE